MKKIIFFITVFLCFAGFSFSQETNESTFTSDTSENSNSFDELGDLGDFSDTESESQSSKFSVTVGGDINAGGNFFLNDFKAFNYARVSSLFRGSLHIEANAPLTKAYFKVKLNDMVLPFHFKNKPILYPVHPQIPRFIDEGYLQATIGAVTFGGGLKKLTWGKADAFSILDVINPKDLSDPTIFDVQTVKIARPMFFVSAYLPKEMQLEAVFLPVFEGNTFALTGRWISNRIAESVGEFSASENLSRAELQRFTAKMSNFLLSSQDIFDELAPKSDTAKLKYAQAGIRYTVTVNGYHDIGFQYYYGFLPNPAVRTNPTALNDFKTKLTSEWKKDAPNFSEIFSKAAKAFSIEYNPYHQIGFDYAAALGPVNLRLEAAANITYDIKGTKPNVYNPSLAWNVGLDYTTPIGLSLNLCAAENIKLWHKNIGTESGDTEAVSKPTETKIMLLLSQPLLRSSLNLNLRTIINVESCTFFLAPSVDFTFATLRFDMQAGFFFGKQNGGFSRFKNNSYIGLSIGYAF